jgi:hypothetical protein
VVTRWLLLLSLLLGACLEGCAATSSQEFLSTPLDEQTPLLQATRAESAPAARPRLEHTITLGETDASYVPPPAAADAGSGANVQVQVQTNVPVTINTYGSYPGDVVAPRALPAQPSTTLEPGQNFPAPASYGPGFPYRSGPASPWAR